jgi:hypothetical protein
MMKGDMWWETESSPSKPEWKKTWTTILGCHIFMILDLLMHLKLRLKITLPYRVEPAPPVC